MNSTHPRWRSFEVEQPKIGEEIVAAQIKTVKLHHGVRHEIIWMSAPFVVASVGVSHVYQTHWCLASELPVVEEPQKRDYCREAWESLPDFKSDYGLIKPCKSMGTEHGKAAMSLEMFRPIWNMAVYAAKIHGVDKV